MLQLDPTPCCGSRCAPCHRCGCVAHRPRPLAQVACSAPGGAPLAPPLGNATSSNSGLSSFCDMLLRNAIYLPCGKCDISASQMRYAINSYAPQRISLREAEYLARQRISQIPPGIYIAASHKWLAKPEFIVFCVLALGRRWFR